MGRWRGLEKEVPMRSMVSRMADEVLKGVEQQHHYGGRICQLEANLREVIPKEHWPLVIGLIDLTMEELCTSVQAALKARLAPAS